MNPKTSSSPLPEAFLLLDSIGQIPELSMVSPELRIGLVAPNEKEALIFNV